MTNKMSQTKKIKNLIEDYKLALRIRKAQLNDTKESSWRIEMIGHNKALEYIIQDLERLLQ